ncbi:MAG: FtsX-like permease family protein [Bacteroidia bacterium]
MSTQPPKRALSFLRWFCHKDHIEELEGDLWEVFESQAQQSEKKAARLFFWNVLLHFRPEYIRPLEGNYTLNNYGMYKNYLKIAWRSMLRQKLYSFINIGGLAIGLTCFLLISLYVQHELSYDRFYENAGRIYRVYQRMEGNTYLGSDKIAYTTVGLAPALVTEYPEVDHATTFRDQAALLGYNENNFYEEGIRADQHFLEVFGHPLLRGNPASVLEKDKSLVLTESLARKMFGEEDPMGKTVLYQNDEAFTVTGIMKDIPTNSSLKFSFLSSILSMEQYREEMAEDQWNNNDYYTFFTLTPNASPVALQDKFPALLQKYIKRNADYPFKDSYYVQSLSDLHLETGINFDIGLKGNAKYISLFTLTGILVLLLACVNYMNLAIARSIRRAGEVGLRKVIGATKGQVMGQFLGESVLIACLALIFSLVLTYYLSPVFGYILDRPIELNFLENIYLFPGLLGLVLIVGIFSGSYPAFRMSSVRPIQVLKGKMEGRVSGFTIQRWLTVGQYAVSIVLIISSFVIYRQFQFIHNKDLGYKTDHVLTISVLDWELPNHFGELENEWAANPNIISVTTTGELPANVTSGTLIRHIDAPKEDRFNIYRARVGYGYLDTYSIRLIAGRDFSRDIQSDREESLIINETAAKAFGWTPEEAIGKSVQDHKRRKIIGVVKDFHMHSMHMRIEPLMLEMRDTWFAFIGVKVRPENLGETMTFLEKSMGTYSPYPFEYKFLDETFDQLYRSDQKAGEMLGFFTILSILIASMGLFGLAAFTAGQRIKEIGIRKVLGASVNSIVTMLSLDFMKMVLWGFLMAIPIAGYVMSQWLQDFAYRIDLEWWVFVLAGGIAALVAFLTISFQSIKAATINPVECLKDE